MAPIRAQELAGFVTPGKATNDAPWAVAPLSLKFPLKVSRPTMPLPLVATRAVPLGAGLILDDDEPVVAGELSADVELAADDPPAAGEPDELQAATPTATAQATARRPALMAELDGAGEDGYFMTRF